MLSWKVGPAVQRIWTLSRNTALSHYETYRYTVLNVLPQVNVVEDQLLERIYPSVEKLINPPLMELQYRLVCPFINATAPNILDAYDMSLRSLYMYCTSMIGRIMQSPEDYKLQLAELALQITTTGSDGCLAITKEILSNMVSVQLLDLAEDIVGFVTPDDIYTRFLDDICELLLNMVYTLEVEISEKGVTNELISIFGVIMRKLALDMAKRQRRTMLSLLNDITESVVQDRMISLCYDLFNKEKVKLNFSDGGVVPTLIQVDYVGTRLIGDMVSHYLKVLVDDAFSTSTAHLNAVLDQLMTGSAMPNKDEHTHTNNI